MCTDNRVQLQYVLHTKYYVLSTAIESGQSLVFACEDKTTAYTFRLLDGKLVLHPCHFRRV
jgi:hypothetical protein